MSGQFTRLSTSKVIYTAMFDLLDQLTARGCELSIDGDGEVVVTNAHLASDDELYELQSSYREVIYWLQAQGR